MIRVNSVQVFKPTSATSAVEARIKSGDDLNLYISLGSQDAFTLASKILKQLASHTHESKALDEVLVNLNTELGLSSLELL